MGLSVGLCSGLIGFYIGGQVMVAARTRECTAKPDWLVDLCQVWVTPGAWWQGGTQGMWLGAGVGGLMAALATSRRLQQSLAPQDRLERQSLFSPTLSSNCFSHEQALSPAELQAVIIEVNRLHLEQNSSLTLAEARDVLEELGLPPEQLEPALARIRDRQQRSE
uniref:hypothetical protein n=1 Tax=Leptolyngbya sp. FACHB-261 TaxID=2692806 RepID=UPI001682EFF8|nr:hypothetical protein [Leptolyngbya sp. FACHB-261]MBD2099518.1 hypothetical protein [Leptolyngbya sp. FACHB-261]